VASRRGLSPHSPRVTSVTQVMPRRRGPLIVISGVFVVALAASAASGETALGRTILTAVQRFMLFYAGVFALIALTAAVGIGLAATDRIVMVPSSRVAAQAVHRAVSLAALGFLVIHIVTEILANRSTVIDAFIPFLVRRRTFYIGLGTIASDLLLILIVTGIARSRFAGKRPWTWRAIHATAYLCWVLSVLHGLLGGRTAKPYVDWSYGACGAAILLALMIRLVATVRDRRETGAQPVPAASSSVPAAMSALAALEFRNGRATLARGRADSRSLPGADENSPRGHYPEELPLQLPQSARGGPGEFYPEYPEYPDHPAATGYAPGYRGGPSPAGAPYWRGPAAGAPASPVPYRRALPAGSSAADPGQPVLPGQSLPPGHPGNPASGPWAQQPYLRARPANRAPSNHGPSNHGPSYQALPYPEEPDPEFLYDDSPVPGPELWPDHPSAPMRISWMTGDQPAYPQPPDAEWL
jgi:DMSO/TMAO reductase YedYZ heme-binding membrane subunit